MDVRPGPAAPDILGPVKSAAGNDGSQSSGGDSLLTMVNAAAVPAAAVDMMNSRLVTFFLEFIFDFLLSQRGCLQERYLNCKDKGRFGSNTF
jgi:hypothetical protein